MQSYKDYILTKEREGYQKRTENMQKDLTHKRQQVDTIVQQERQFVDYKQRQREQQKNENARAYYESQMLRQ